MSTSKLDKIARIEAEMEELKQRKTKLLQEHNAQERKARTHRLCKRAGLIEKLLPELADLDDLEFETFVNKTMLTSFTDKIIREIVSSRVKSNPSPDGNNSQEQVRSTAEHTQPKPQTKSASPSPHKPAQAQAAQPRANSSGT